MKRWLGMMALILAGGWVYAAEVPQQAVLVNEAGLAYNKQYPIDISGVRSLSMQVNYASATIASQTFSDGTQSTGALTVVSFTALSSATASAQITISSNAGLANQTLFIAGNNIPIRVDLTASSMTACNIAADIASKTVFLSTCAIGNASGIVYSTAPTYGSSYNSFSVQSTSLTAISSAPFTGGRDNQSFSINGVTLKANTDFFPVTSTNQTATNIATAINASASLNTKITAAAATNVVTTTANIVGVATNYAVTTSSNAALTINGAVTLLGPQGSGTMTGGTNAAFNYNSATFNIPTHGFTTALPVLYTAGSATAGGLTNQTTYYVVVVDANNIKLSSTSVVALTGNAIVITSTATQSTAHTVTLTPGPILGTPSFKWQVSNDQTNWADWTANIANVSISSVTLLSYTAGGATTAWDPGQVDYNWLRLNVLGPTQGGIVLKAFVTGKP